jgi:ATP-dependent RNA helicase DeaD
MEKFKQLGLSEGILSAIRELGFSQPSEIQIKTIPLVLSGKDVIGSSATGSGKTLAFGAGIIEKIKKGHGIQALVMVPTRELAEQVSHTLRIFSRHFGLNVKGIYGGVAMDPQIRDLRYANIVVGTPGRILDHLRRRTLNLDRIKFLVLDEADRMLDMGFIKDIESIIKICPKERQTLLFSATISQEIDHIAKRHMKSPVEIAVENQVDPSLLYQTYYDVSTETKFSLLVHLLKFEKKGIVMVFCNTRRNVDRLTKGLNQQKIHALAIHGGLSQSRRSNTLQAFHKRETLILVCTDVAARGLDIKDVSHVYNFDIPSTSTDYIHRIGRTARAGKNGIAVSFVCPGDHGEFRQISRDGEVEIERLNVPKLESVIPINFSSNMDRKTNWKNGRGRSNGYRRNERPERSSRGGYGGTIRPRSFSGRSRSFNSPRSNYRSHRRD